MKRALLAIGVACALGAASHLARADEGFDSSKWWLVNTVRSYHFDRKETHNESNYGIGAEYTVNKDWTLAAGEYTNSNSETSTYASVVYTPFYRANMKLGLTLGLVSGYRVDPSPLFAPTLAIEGKNVGLNILAIPPFDGGDWVLGFQVKWRFQ